MNGRQFLILILTIAIIAAIFYFTPRYKMVSLGSSGNYIRTEQSSPLFKKCTAQVQYDWPIILKRAGVVFLAGIALIFIFKDRSRP
ncbi:MAG: hypothetical protein V1674_06485 [Candidatus Omnitrophota bacterium]